MNYNKLILKVVLVIIWMTIKTEDFNHHNILIDEKSYQNILGYNILYKTFIAAKPLRIRFDKIDGFIIVNDGTRYLVLFVSG